MHTAHAIHPSAFTASGAEAGAGISARPIASLKRWHAEQVSIRQLRALPDRLLADLGISRDRIPELVRSCSRKVQ